MAEAPTSIAVYTKLQRIAKQASDAPQIVFNNLIHLVDLKLLREAYRLTRKNGAPGINRVTALEYGLKVDRNCRDRRSLAA